MRIRCFNPVEPTSSYYRHLLPHLAAVGHDVSVLISDAIYRDASDSFSSKMAAAGVSVDLIKLGRRRAGHGRQRAALYARYILSSAPRTLLGPGADVNFFLTQPPFFFLWGLVLKALRRQRYIIVVLDLYPDVLVESGLASRRGLFVRLAGWLVRLGHRKADAVLVIGRCTRERMIRDGVRPDRIHLVPNWPPTDVRLMPRLENSLRGELGIGSRFVVMYSGNMGVSHRFDDILEVAHRFRDEDRIRFVFAGDGPRRREVERAVAERELGNVLLLPFQPVEKLHESLALGDLHFVSLRKGFEALVVPSKTYGVLGVGRPVIYQGARTGEIARMIDEEGIGIVVDIGDVDSLERALRAYWTAHERVEAEGRRAVALAMGRYSRSAALERYANAFASVAANL